MGKKQLYTIWEKREALAQLEVWRSLAAVARSIPVPESTLRDWRKSSARIFAYEGSERSKTLKGQGGKEIIPFAHGLIVYMKDRRRDEKVLSSLHMIAYMKQEHSHWLKVYLTGLANPYNTSCDCASDSPIGTIAIVCILSHFLINVNFVKSHGFSRRIPCYTKEPAPELLATRDAFAVKFWSEYGLYEPHEILNMDETAIYFDTPPTRIWAVKGGSAKVDATQKHSARLTAVMTIRGDGKKLPIFFILKAQQGGTIEASELPTYPAGHYYTVQSNRWMNSVGWKANVMECQRFQVHGPSVLLLDNFDAHVSVEGQQLATDQACCSVCPLPPNSTSVCQPLDVGVMGPLKAKMRMLWLTEDNGPTPTAAQKRLAMIRRTIAAWEDVSEKTIARSFKAALPKPTPEITEFSC